MSYQVLARKWRPRSFPEMVGQEHVVRALSNALDNDRLHHAYLFTGTRGVGKTTLARILAKSLNCETGVTSRPCGECAVCREVDEGRFVDLLEVDAASKTGVDDTRELLDNVPYAPVRGRYKVYLIDEVHMFSNHSFNALLKTLEEPPPHVKFLLATTDPQKVPVTVLSRCLQFNLKRLPLEQIQQQFEMIAQADAINTVPEALALLARAADGSMRDGLSLLDQAIAFGGGDVMPDGVKVMLGVSASDVLPALLQAVDDNDAKGMLETIEALADQAADFDRLLKDMLTLLHRIALLQAAPESARASWGDPAPIAALAARLGPEEVQLYYEIALHGQRDLPITPDARSGFEMTLLRMLAFRPDADEGATSGESPPAAARRTDGAPAADKGSRRPPAAQVKARPAAAGDAAERPVQRVAEETPSPPGKPVEKPGGDEPAPYPDLSDWHQVLGRLGLSGMAAQLAAHCTVTAWKEGSLELALDPQSAGLHGKVNTERLQQALDAYCGRPVRMQIAVTAPADETPAQRDARKRAERQRQVEADVADDPLVSAMRDTFDAEIVADSVRPVDRG